MGRSGQALLLLAAVLAFWVLQWRAVPQGRWLDRVMGWPEPVAESNAEGD